MRFVDLSHVITDGMQTYPGLPVPQIADGHDLTALALERVADVPALCLDRTGQRAIELDEPDVQHELADAAGKAVLIRTDHAAAWGTNAYFDNHPYLTEAAARRLVDSGVACVGIDSLNIDSTSGGERPVHTVLLGADIPIVEHLTALEQLPASGFRFTAVPPKIEGAGTFTVRAYATLDDADKRP